MPKSKSKKPDPRSRFTEPFLADTSKMTPEERAKFEEIFAAHRAALKGNYGPGRKLGLFPPET